MTTPTTYRDEAYWANAGAAVAKAPPATPDQIEATRRFFERSAQERPER